MVGANCPAKGLVKMSSILLVLKLGLEQIVRQLWVPISSVVNDDICH